MHSGLRLFLLFLRVYHEKRGEDIKRKVPRKVIRKSTVKNLRRMMKIGRIKTKHKAKRQRFIIIGGLWETFLDFGFFLAETSEEEILIIVNCCAILL